MRGHLRKLSVLAVAFVCLAVLSVSAHATNLNVYCGGKRLPNTINGALKMLNPQGPNTLTVSGTCKENVVIKTFDNLTLQTMQATPGATINDASGGTLDVITIQDSTRITIQGFTINGGGEGVICYSHSLCRFNGNRIQGSAGNGVSISRARAEFTGNVIQNHSNGYGLHVREAGEALTNGDTIEGNGAGVLVIDGSFLYAAGTTVQGNGDVGMEILDHSTLRADAITVTGNGGPGVFLGRASEARFMGDGSVITGNNGDGVFIRDLSFAYFGPDNNISGNFSGTDVGCYPQFSATRGVANIAPGTTNCVEPSQPSHQEYRAPSFKEGTR